MKLDGDGEVIAVDLAEEFGASKSELNTYRKNEGENLSLLSRG
ncbi:hypothetical protein [Methanofollis aquaemaris]|nr:hypothetical protein [Methanofollis aquaemaris]